MGCNGVIDRFNTRFEFDKATNTIMVYENRIRQFVGADAKTSAEAYFDSIVVGSDAVLTHAPVGVLMYSVINDKQLGEEHHKSCDVSIIIKAKYFKTESDLAYLLSIEESLCTTDYIINKVPNGDTVYIDLGKHYKEVNYVATGSDKAAVEALLTSQTGKLISGRVIQDKGENTFTGNALYHEACI